MTTRREAEQLCTRLKERREELGLSLYGLEKQTGIRRTNLHRWEHGDADPSLCNLIRWAKALGLNYIQLQN